jgi:hypothetical protein
LGDTVVAQARYKQLALCRRKEGKKEGRKEERKKERKERKKERKITFKMRDLCLI